MGDEILGKSSFDISYLETFRKALWDITDKDELIASVPDSRFHGYIELLNYFLEYASEEINDIMEEFSSTTDLGDHEYLKRELDLAKLRIGVFSSLIEEFRINEEKQKEFENTPGERQIIYLYSKAGNCLFESDISDLTIEELDDMKSAFDILKNDLVLSDPRKFKTLNNNRNIRGVREAKSYQARIYFYHLEKDIVIAFLALGKKGDDPKREKERLVKRAQALYDEMGAIRKKLADPVMREEILSQSREVTDRIEEMLNPKKVGKK